MCTLVTLQIITCRSGDRRLGWVQTSLGDPGALDKEIRSCSVSRRGSTAGAHPFVLFSLRDTLIPSVTQSCPSHPPMRYSGVTFTED